MTLGRAWCFNGEEERLELERDHYLFGLWYLAALLEQGRPWRLRYDSLQHTCYMFVDESGSAALPVERGTCAFFSTQSDPGTAITWNDGSWNPIVSGFLLASD
jgi:hypothetical protein